jgi:hypothetical protein
VSCWLKHYEPAAFLTALEERDWGNVKSMLTDDYLDDYGHDRDSAVEDAKQALKVDEVIGLVDDLNAALRPSLLVRLETLSDEEKKQKVSYFRFLNSAIIGFIFFVVMMGWFVPLFIFASKSFRINFFN